MTETYKYKFTCKEKRKDETCIRTVSTGHQPMKGREWELTALRVDPYKYSNLNFLSRIYKFSSKKKKRHDMH